MEPILPAQPATIHAPLAMQERVVIAIPVLPLEPLRCLIHVLAVLPISSLRTSVPLALSLARLAVCCLLTVPRVQPPRVIFRVISAFVIMAITRTG